MSEVSINVIRTFGEVYEDALDHVCNILENYKLEMVDDFEKDRFVRYTDDIVKVLGGAIATCCRITEAALK